jgi:membrane-bound lytic murein transglycosylase D
MAPVPDIVSICGKPMPLFDEDVREQFEREFYQFLENRGLLTMLVRRQAKFLTVVSDEIERTKMPPDLIFLAIAESYLNPRVKSVADAGGLWQFVKETGKRHGLFINDDIDERYTVTRSTRSALGYLKKLNDEFADWFLAMAAYNCGEGRVREAIANQNSRSFFELFLPEETTRYIYRIAAIKEILGNPGKYGLPAEKGDSYRPYEVAEMTIELDKETHTNVFAQAMQLSYKAFRGYNLHIRRYKLPRGVYHLYVPLEKKEIFLKGIKSCPGVVLQKEE